MWAHKTCLEKYNIEQDTEIDDRILDFESIGLLAKIYLKEGVGEIERWHNKLGHVGMKILRACNIPNLKVPNTPFRCESCIKGKMHTGNHSSRSTGKKTDLQPGEYIITDLQGPYVRNRNGEKYSQLFIDVASKRVWVVRLKKKKESGTMIEKVLADCRTRSGKKIRILITDRDGIFGQSKKFQDLKERKLCAREAGAIRPPTKCNYRP